MRVLIAEDDSISCRILRATLTKWGYEVVVASDGNEAWGILERQDAPDLAIIDWIMPGMDGVELCQRVRARSDRDHSYTYIILLTARDRKEDIVEGMNAGADDYVTKPFDPGELKVRLIAARRILDLEARLLAAQQAVRQEAMHDYLTKLWNRPAIEEILTKELARARREDGCVALILIDIDHFKRVNDTWGHKEGDRVLRRTAEIMRSNLRAYDAIGRYGGEEFLIIMPGCEAKTAATRADSLREELAKTEIPVSGRTVSLTVSIGVTASCDHDTDDVDLLIHAADEAMYRAKHAGRNRVEIATRAA